MPTHVYLLRHAETSDPSVFHGCESDIDLSPRGFLQAEAIARTLADVKPEVLIASGMRRARDTAQAIAMACNLEMRIEPMLHERRIGILSGTSHALKQGIWPETQRRWQAGETSYAHEGAESFDDIRARVMPVWERLTTEYAGRRLVVVAHGIVCKVILLTLLPDWTWETLGSIRNVAIHELVHEENGWRALRLNHLPAELM